MRICARRTVESKIDQPTRAGLVRWLVATVGVDLPPWPCLVWWLRFLTGVSFYDRTRVGYADAEVDCPDICLRHPVPWVSCSDAQALLRCASEGP